MKYCASNSVKPKNCKKCKPETKILQGVVCCRIMRPIPKPFISRARKMLSVAWNLEF